jgi:FixJ family two-component response regulator
VPPAIERRFIDTQQSTWDDFLVAIVEDEAAIREATERLLKVAGFKAANFASAHEFLQFPGRHRVRCLVLDVGLPQMNGLDLQRRLADDGLDIPVVFITARDDSSGRLQAQALQAGAVAFLRKPFIDEDLLNAVRSAFARPM